MEPGPGRLRRKVYLMFSRKMVVVVVVASLTLVLAAPAAAAPREEGFLSGFWSLFERLVPSFGAPQKSDYGPGIDPNAPSSLERGPAIDPNVSSTLDNGPAIDPNTPSDPSQDVGAGIDPSGGS
jgi:hypothetical protein